MGGRGVGPGGDAPMGAEFGSDAKDTEETPGCGQGAPPRRELQAGCSTPAGACGVRGVARAAWLTAARCPSRPTPVPSPPAPRKPDPRQCPRGAAPRGARHTATPSLTDHWRTPWRARGL
ncbi:hypothetical protein E2C01_083862 [Portunus trituberculatus]|uniref:Uncharacterized protein n=1 Tax=Portunus trituberculatus TaxID=210409 RepID=A0A5B7J5Y8_PORTR|nr:hypothetical protein [Portunus trituberculatus]